MIYVSKCFEGQVQVQHDSLQHRECHIGANFFAGGVAFAVQKTPPGENVLLSCVGGNYLESLLLTCTANVAIGLFYVFF